MHVALVTDGAVPGEGGVSTHIETLALGLRELGHRATVVSTVEPGDLLSRIAREADCCLHRHGGYPGRIARFLRAHGRHARQLAHGLARACSDGGCDVVNLHGVMAMRAATAVARRLGLPAVLTVHDYLAAGFVGVRVIRGGSSWERRFLAWETEAFEAAASVVAVDTRLGRHVEGLTDGRVQPQVIHNCVHPAFLELGSSRQRGVASAPFVILCARRLTPKNGVTFAVEMARELSQRGVDFVLNLAGSGEERGLIEAAIARHGLGPRVRLLGAIDRCGMLEQMRRCSAVIVPSVTHEGVEEATSISVMEGMAAGLPVIGSRVGGITELIAHGSTGLLVEQRSAAALADAICSLRAEPGWAARLGAAAHQHARECFSHTVHAGKLLAVYQRCLATTPG